MKLFFDVYATSEAPTSKYSLQALVLLSSIRRSLFNNEKERTVFLQTLMDNIEHIMTTRVGLNDLQNYHEFCRLLGRLKTSYQLSELVKTANFKCWLELATNFTIMSFQSWQHCMNSIHYLLALWGPHGGSNALLADTGRPIGCRVVAQLCLSGRGELYPHNDGIR